MPDRPGNASRSRTNLFAAPLAAVASIVAAIAMPATGCQRDQRPANVILVSVDTMRADRTGLAGYCRNTTPNLDRWFGEKGRVHLRSWSAEASTTPSVVSMLSGLLPQQHRVRMLVQLVPKDLALLPDLLPEGWQSAGFVSNMMLTNEASGLGAHFDHYDDFVDERELYRADTFERNAGRTTDSVLAWLDEGRAPSKPVGDHALAKPGSEAYDPSKPLFLWVHYMDPHGPYHAPDDWKRTFHHDLPLPIDIDRVLSFEREPGVTDGLAYVDAYDEEIAYTDAHVGRLLDGLAARLGGDRNLYVFTADHGESLMDHETWFRHAVQVYDEMVRVPLLLRGPGVVPGRSELSTSGIDLVPTILRALGVPLPSRVPDVDLRSDAGLTPERIVYTEASLSARDGGDQWRAAIQNGAKWVIGVRKGDCEAQKRRYDLTTDRDELTIKAWTGDGAAPQSLMKLCREDPDPSGIPASWIFGAGLKGPKSPPMSGEEQLRSLKALGYAE